MASPAAMAATERIKAATKDLDSSTRGMISDAQSSLVILKMIAEDLERLEDSEAVAKLDQATIELIGVTNEMQQHSSALQYLGDSYQFPTESTDFKEVLEKYLEQREKETPSNPQDHPYYKQFKEAIWNVRHAGDPMPGQEQEDIVMMTTQCGILNMNCPLSGKPITELQDPVRSIDCHHVYEREIVMAYINKNGSRRPCMCAAAGCPKKLTIQSLKCDTLLKMEIAELRIRGASSNQVVDDCTELE